MSKQTFCRIPGPGETRACIDPWIFVYVRASGDVDACCRGVTIGNLAQRSLEDVVNGPEAIELRRQVLSGELPPGCQRCATRPVTSVENLNRMVEHLVFEADALEQEDLRRQVREHRAVRADLLRERAALAGHAATVERLLEESRRHAANLEPRLDETRRHAANLQDLLDETRRHAANLESERPHLQGHIANLERELAELRGILSVATKPKHRLRLPGFLRKLARRP